MSVQDPERWPTKPPTDPTRLEMRGVASYTLPPAIVPNPAQTRAQAFAEAAEMVEEHIDSLAVALAALGDEHTTTSRSLRVAVAALTYARNHIEAAGRGDR